MELLAFELIDPITDDKLVLRPIEGGVAIALVNPDRGISTIKLDTMSGIALSRALVTLLEAGIGLTTEEPEEDAEEGVSCDCFSVGFDEGYARGFAEGEESADAQQFDDLERVYYAGIDEGEESGYNEGFAEGFVAGYEKDKDDSYDEGYYDGLEEGKALGMARAYDFDRGYQLGFDEGEESGEEDGFSAGFDQGLAEGTLDAFQEIADFAAEEASKLRTGLTPGDLSDLAQHDLGAADGIEYFGAILQNIVNRELGTEGF